MSTGNASRMSAECVCGAQPVFKVGEVVRLNRKGRSVFPRLAKRKAVVCGSTKFFGCIRVKFDGHKRSDVYAVSFFHNSPHHSAFLSIYGRPR